MTQSAPWNESNSGAFFRWATFFLCVVVLLSGRGEVQAQEDGAEAAYPGRVEVEATCDTQDISIELDADQTHFVLRIPNCVCFVEADGLEEKLRAGWTGGETGLELIRVLGFGETMPAETYYCYPRDLVDRLIQSHSVPPPPEYTFGDNDDVIDA
jgi:hypothetical protein